MSQAERWQLGGNAPEVYETRLVPAIFGPWAPLLVAQAALHAGERVLDVACGTGVVTRSVAPEVGPTGHVVGLDLNPGMLARARAFAQPEGAAIDWREGDAGALPFDASSFDAVFCQLGFQYFPDRQQAARGQLCGSWRPVRDKRGMHVKRIIRNAQSCNCPPVGESTCCGS